MACQPQNGRFVQAWVPFIVVISVIQGVNGYSVMNWKQMTGKNKQKLGKLSDENLTTIEEWRDQLARLFQQRYGYAKEQTETGCPTAVGARLYTILR